MINVFDQFIIIWDKYENRNISVSLSKKIFGNIL